MNLFLNLLVAIGVVSALKELPERARGGLAYKEYLKKMNPLTLSAHNGDSTPLTWNAKVDNFDAKNAATYAQRYYVNDKYWTKGGPVFYEIGGEGTLSGPPGGYIEQLALKHGALLIALEHRFYGESIPNGNANSDNYKYLTVEQALADLSGFTDYYKTAVPDSAAVPWFVFGGSYPGALSSWYRAAYPDQSVGSLSSSGVVNCIIDYYGFDQSVSAAAGNDCADQIKHVQSAFQRTIEGSETGLQTALSLFNCESDMSVNDFYYMIADSWSMTIQYSAKTAFCTALDKVNSASTDEEVMKNFADYSNSYWGENFCAGGFYNTKQLSDPARWDVNSRSWRYQTCAQVSYFNTAPKTGSLRAESVNLDYHLQQCAAAFGKKMFPASIQMNQRFGGAFPTAHNVFYSDFSDDPWQRASVDFPPSSDQPYFLSKCDNCGHCLDFHSATDADPAPLQESRAQFEEYLTQWLADGAKKIAANKKQ